LKNKKIFGIIKSPKKNTNNKKGDYKNGKEDH
jgi:hypothetical protein